MRIVVITLLATIITFAVALLCGIVAIAVANVARGGGIDMSHAYLHVAFPTAMVALVIAFCGALIVEVRHYRQERAAWREQRYIA